MMDLSGKFWWCVQMVPDLLHLLGQIELESGALIIVAFLMLPFIFGSLWSLGMSVIIQLFWLGVKTGFLMFSMSSCYMTYLRCSKTINWRGILDTHILRRKTDGRQQLLTSRDDDAGELNCTLMDMMLSIYFQTGFHIPTIIWDTGMNMLAGNETEPELPGQEYLMDIKPLVPVNYQMRSALASGYHVVASNPLGLRTPDRELEHTNCPHIVEEPETGESDPSDGFSDPGPAEVVDSLVNSKFRRRRNQASDTSDTENAHIGSAAVSDDNYPKKRGSRRRRRR